MKKIVSMLAAFAMAAALLVSCSNGSTTPKSEPEATVTPAFTISYTGINGEAYFDVQDDWKSLEIEFVELDDSMQFAVKSNEVKADHGSWKEYFANYYPAKELKTTFVIADEDAKLKEQDASATIGTIGIQNNAEGEATYKVLSAKVTKTDDTVVDVKPRADGWNSSIN